MDVSTNRSNVAPPDSTLIKQAQAANSEAYGVLYERYFDAVYRYVFYRLGNVEDTEDITTIVFLRAWQRIESYVDNGLPFLAWLYRIAHNLIVDFYRKNKAKLVDIDAQTELLDDAPDLERQITRDLQLQDVIEAIAKLNQLQQEVLTLRFLVGLSHREVATIINRTEGAVRIIQYRALQALRDTLKPTVDDSDFQ